MAGYDNYMKLLLHGNNDFNDSSPSNRGAATQYASVAISNTIRKLGSGSIDIRQGYCSFPYSSDWDICTTASGITKFTIDSWIYPDDTYYASTSCIIFIQAGSFPSPTNYTWLNIFLNSTNVNFQFIVVRSASIAVNNQFTWSYPIPQRTWHHVAVVRNGNTANDWYGFLDGNLSTSKNITHPNPNVTALNAPLNIGGPFTSPTRYGQCFVDDFTWSTNIARWTSNFTPHQAEYNTSTTFPMVSFQ